MTFSEATGSTLAPDVSVVIPVCNEQDNVEPLAREIHQALSGSHAFETIFVDDGSTDGTAPAVTRARAAGMPEIRLIRHAVRSGQSAAVATGVRAARARWVATLDGDGQNDPADITGRDLRNSPGAYPLQADFLDRGRVCRGRARLSLRCDLFLLIRSPT